MSSKAELDAIFARLTTAYNTLSADPKKATPKDKAQLKSAALELISATQTPHENAFAFATQNSVYPCYRVAGDCGLLAKWPKEVMSAGELAELTGAEERLVVRIMRVLTSSGVFTEVGEATYKHNTLSTTLSNPGFLSTAKFLNPGISNLPEYLAATSYRNPGSNPDTATPFQCGNNTPLTFYQALAADSKARNGFDAQMKQSVLMERARFPKGFAETYDFEGEFGSLIKGEEDVAIVDVGGSGGHVLGDIIKHLPGLKGRKVLEDLPETVESVTAPDGIEVVGYNFLEGIQPIKGAACYLFRQVFLNWSDAKGKQILQNTLPAMTRGHSRILIMEPVMPPMKAPLMPAMIDIVMSQMGGQIRTEKMWRAFLDEAGFEVVKIVPSNSNQTVIEAVPKK
ncbi:S-adenosyl-L-methionine-dependent methyltransferase [Tothia fuscella]|uniref:S-adenosyl-L-methionine-dependent methyltransferase n=1 Tax=Tothia fuscella TaxID=1048955 RepID=A0A9P4NQ93_9PEZI|nr:S-adenosyl-L-methionine-dependent methyltransferase [Tothia fuscella]